VLSAWGLVVGIAFHVGLVVRVVFPMWVCVAGMGVVGECGEKKIIL
jgi:hypothetical protein